MVSARILPVISALVFANGQNEDNRDRRNWGKPLEIVANRNCRNRIYPRNQEHRCIVPDEKVPWSEPFYKYDPPYITMPENQRDVRFTDPDRLGDDFQPKWNAVDNNISRISYIAKYDIVNSLPVNPIGRTGVAGKGILARWGPNHSVHLIITRYKLDLGNTPVINRFTGMPILELIAIRSFEQVKWAVPGRLLLEGESLESAVKRTFFRGIISIVNLRKSPEEEKLMRERIDQFFDNGEIMYQGYVDDQRNTDNAWVETTVLHYHDQTRDVVANMTLINSDRVIVKWIRVSTRIHWIARHFFFMSKITKRLFQDPAYPYQTSY